MKDPNIIIIMEDGVVTSVVSDVDLHFTVVDYSVEKGVDMANTSGIAMIPQGKSAVPAWTFQSYAYVDGLRVEEIEEAVNKSYEG